MIRPYERSEDEVNQSEPHHPRAQSHAHSAPWLQRGKRAAVWAILQAKAGQSQEEALDAGEKAGLKSEEMIAAVRRALESLDSAPRRTLNRRCAVPDKTVAQKARVKPGTTIAVINRVAGIVESLGLPKDVSFVRPAGAQLVFLFVRTRAELKTRMPKAVAALGPASQIWVFFRKGSKDAGLDMNRDTVWAVAETLDLRPLGIVGVNDTWSAFRLRRAS